MENTEPKDNSGQKTVKRVIKKRIISDAAGRLRRLRLRPGTGRYGGYGDRRPGYGGGGYGYGYGYGGGQGDGGLPKGPTALSATT